jgi:hypothetical protein
VILSDERTVDETFAKASAGDGLSAVAFITAGVVLPVLVTVACMSSPAV